MAQKSYCTSSDLKTIFPQIDEYDTKSQIYGFSLVDGETNKWVAYNTGLVNNLFADGKYLGISSGSEASVNSDEDWYFNESLDTLWLYLGNNIDPNDKLMESGENWNSTKKSLISDASNYFDSRVDGSVPRSQFKTQDGTYDYLVIRTTALITCTFLLKAHDPTNEIVGVFEEEINFNIELINSGKSKLSYQVSGDADKGSVKEIGVSGTMYIVDTRGSYSGTYDRIMVAIVTGGLVGVATYDVSIKSADKLKSNKVVSSKVITGDYQPLAGGLEIRFQGSGDSASAIAGDEWEVEVFGQQESLDDNIGAVKYTSMSRTNRPYIKGYGYIG